MFKAALASYTQVGLDINGTAAYEQFGASVSMSDDGTSFVTGTPNADSYRGVVRVFKRDTNVSGMISYIQVGLDIVGKAANDYFGSSVSMSGDGTSFVVGARRSYSGNGSVSVFKYSTTMNSYDQVGPDIFGKAIGDLFGWSVSMSGDGTSFVAGAPIGSSNNGSVSVFKYNRTMKSYVQVGPDIVGKASGDQFGASVSMSGDGTSFVVGAQHSNDNRGSVRVYKYKNDMSSYDQVGLDIVGKARNDLFGTSVSMSSNGASFAVGAMNNFDYGCFCYTSPGYVRVYKNSINSTGSYDQVGPDIAGVKTGDQFGASVSMSGNGATVLVGAPRNGNVKGVESGLVRLYGDAASTKTPTTTPTSVPTAAPTKAPSAVPTTSVPTTSPTRLPTVSPTSVPTAAPTKAPTTTPTSVPTTSPTKAPTTNPTSIPTAAPTKAPTASPTTKAPRATTTKAPSKAPVFVISPTETPIASNEKCGFLGLNLFCPRSGKCGFMKRLLNLGGCS